MEKPLNELRQILKDEMREASERIAIKENRGRKLKTIDQSKKLTIYSKARA